MLTQYHVLCTIANVKLLLLFVSTTKLFVGFALHYAQIFSEYRHSSMLCEAKIMLK